MKNPRISWELWWWWGGDASLRTPPPLSALGIWIARLLEALWVRIQTYLKNTKWAIKAKEWNTLSPAKKYTEKYIEWRCERFFLQSDIFFLCPRSREYWMPHSMTRFRFSFVFGFPIHDWSFYRFNGGFVTCDHLRLTIRGKVKYLEVLKRKRTMAIDSKLLSFQVYATRPRPIKDNFALKNSLLLIFYKMFIHIVGGLHQPGNSGQLALWGSAFWEVEPGVLLYSMYIVRTTFLFVLRTSCKNGERSGCIVKKIYNKLTVFSSSWDGLSFLTYVRIARQVFKCSNGPPIIYKCHCYNKVSFVMLMACS
jgi:hypothetical protein